MKLTDLIIFFGLIEPNDQKGQMTILIVQNPSAEFMFNKTVD